MAAVQHSRYVPTRPTKPVMRSLNCLLHDSDFAFLDFGAQRLGITRSEFLRRVIHDARTSWMKAGIYRPGETS